MDDNFDDKSMEQQPGNSAESKKRIDSIPLWLQGIAENNAARNAAAEESVDVEWQTEQTPEPIEETGPVPLELTDQLPPKEGEDEASPKQENDLPNWVRELKKTSDAEELKTFPNISETPFDQIETEAEVEDENTEEVFLSPTEEPEIQAEAVVEADQVETEEAMPPAVPEPEVEAQIEESKESFDDEIISENEEIPDWLREMIAADEKQKHQTQAQQKAGYSDEATQPVTVGLAAEEQVASLQEGIDEGFLIVEDTVQRPEAAEGFDQPDESAGIPEPSLEDDSAAQPFRRAVMPTANWSRLADLSDQGEEEPQGVSPAVEEEQPPLASEVVEVSDAEPENELEPEAEGSEDFSPQISVDEFAGSGFQPIEFTPRKAEPEEEQQRDEEIVSSPEIFEDPAPAEDPEPAQTEQTFSFTEIKTDSPEPDELPIEMINGVPSSLFQAKQILDQGEVNQALQVIKPYISQSEYLEEIKGWLLKADEKIEKNKAELWEALGDIASQQGDFSTALSAYAQAIDFLELARNKTNEVG